MSDGPIDGWMARYLDAWTTNEPAAIGALFTDDAIYRPTPFGNAWLGRPAIVEGWLARKDEPGDWTFRHQVLCGSVNSAVVRGWTAYPGRGSEYSNIWLVRFGAEGRCAEFTEWWVERGQPDPGQPPG